MEIILLAVVILITNQRVSLRGARVPARILQKKKRRKSNGTYYIIQPTIIYCFTDVNVMHMFVYSLVYAVLDCLIYTTLTHSHTQSLDLIYRQLCTVIIKCNCWFATTTKK